MIVSFRPIGKREHALLVGLGVGDRVKRNVDRRWIGSVVMIDGCVVVAFGNRDEVIYQDGSDAVPHLVRAHKRVTAAFETFTYDDYERVKRKGKPRPTVEDILTGRS